jgi:uncharacterized protein YkwD
VNNTTAAPVTTTSAPDSGTVSQIESEVLRLTNAARADNGLAPLTSDTALANIARAHSVDMLTHNYFSHPDLTGCDGACRMTNAGYSWQAMGENIHMMSGYHLSVTDTAQKIVTDWMNSPGHRANILNSSFTHAGIGIAMEGDTIYTTADYSLPR